MRDALPSTTLIGGGDPNKSGSTLEPRDGKDWKGKPLLNVREPSEKHQILNTRKDYSV